MRVMVDAERVRLVALRIFAVLNVATWAGTDWGGLYMVDAPQPG